MTTAIANGAAPARAHANSVRNISTALEVYWFVYHRWMGEHQVRIPRVKQVIENDAGGQEEIEQGKVKPVTVRLIPDHWQRRLSRAYADLDAAIERMTLPFVRGTRALPRAAKPSFEVQFNAARRNLDAVIGQFVNAYPEDVVQAARDYWLNRIGPELFYEKINCLLLAPEDVRRRFGVTPVVESIEIPEFRAAASALDAEALKNKVEEMNEAVDRLFQEPAARLGAAIDELLAYWDNSRRFTPDSFGRVRSAIGLVQSFRELAPASLVAHATALCEAIDQAENTATVHRSLNPKLSWQDALATSRDSLTALATKVAEESRDALAIEAVRQQYGRAARAID